MAKDNRLRDAQLIEGLLEQVRLGIRSPDDVPWPRAMPKTGTIEHHDPVVLGCEIDQSTRDEILDHAAIAVKQDQRLASAAFQIVQANPLDVDEPTLRRIIALRFVREPPVYDCGSRNEGTCGSKRGGARMSRDGAQAIG